MVESSIERSRLNSYPLQGIWCFKLKLVFVSPLSLSWGRHLPLSSLFFPFISVFRFDRDWKKIEAFVGSKSVIQVILIEQKNFLCLKCRIIFSISQFKSRYFILVCSLKVSILSFSC